VNVSGNGAPGPGLNALLADVASGEIDIVVVTGLGRLGRSAAVLNAVISTIEAEGARVVTAVEGR
jgi:DNA invertase Pin-like site-specific DNA recombinase